MEPDFIPAALALGSGIHGAAALLFRGIASGALPTVEDVPACFASLWALETSHRPVRFGSGTHRSRCSTSVPRMLAVLCAEVPAATDVVAVESAFAVPLVDQATGAVLDRDLVGTSGLRRARCCRAPGRGRPQNRGSQVLRPPSEASLQFSIYSYATAMNGLTDEADLRLRSTCS